MITPVIHSIRQKLIHWSSKKLSLVGRIIVANQVLLATTWYNLLCWTMSKESIHQIQRMVHNYIWFGKEDHAARAKVVWPIITSPKSRGGLSLIDSLPLYKALLAKFVVWGLQAWDDCWKMLLQLSFAYFSPRKGANPPPTNGMDSKNGSQTEFLMPIGG